MVVTRARTQTDRTGVLLWPHDHPPVTQVCYYGHLTTHQSRGTSRKWNYVLISVDEIQYDVSVSCQKYHVSYHVMVSECMWWQGVWCGVVWYGVVWCGVVWRVVYEFMCQEVFTVSVQLTTVWCLVNGVKTVSYCRHWCQTVFRVGVSNGVGVYDNCVRSVVRGYAVLV